MPDKSYSKELEDILRSKYPDVIVKYWGHDPDDLDMGTEEDGWSGTYEAYMVNWDIKKWLAEDSKWLYDQCFEKKFALSHPSIIFHSPEDTKQYYPEVYAEYLRRVKA